MCLLCDHCKNVLMTTDAGILNTNKKEYNMFLFLIFSAFSINCLSLNKSKALVTRFLRVYII